VADFFITFLEAQQSSLQFWQRVEIVGRENLALHDGEVALDLIEPTGVNRCLDRNNRGPAGSEPPDALLAAVRGAISKDPKEALGRAIGLLTHYFPDQCIELA